SMLSGTTINCLLVASETWVNEITPDASRGRVMGLYGTTMAAALACGPLIIPLAGITGWTPFLIGAALIAIAAIPLFWATNVSPTMHGKASFNPLSFAVIAPVMVAGVLLFSWKDSIASNLLPVFSVRSGLSQSGAATTLTVLGLGGVFLTYPVGILADRFNRYALMTLCGAGVGLLATLLPVVVGTSSYWLVLFFWGGLFSGLYTLILTIIGQRYRGIDLAIANVAIGAVFGVGTLTGPVLTGIAMDIWDPHGFAVVFAAFSLCFVIFSSLRWYLTPNKEVAL
ncbi:MAG: MFS transporter, partial [Pseudomonadales bacterium]